MAHSWTPYPRRQWLFVPYTRLFVVPAGVTEIFVDKMVGAGASGGGGSANAAGGGGGAGLMIEEQVLPVTPLSVLNLIIGVGQLGGAIGTDGVDGQPTYITGGLIDLPTAFGGARGRAGTATLGGNGGGSNVSGAVQNSSSTGGTGAGPSGSYVNVFAGGITAGTGAGAGAGPSAGGGGFSRAFQLYSGSMTIPGGTGIGGGAGGNGKYGNGGPGGNQGFAGGNASGYGAGGGGGGLNAAGGASTGGFIILSWYV